MSGRAIICGVGNSEYPFTNFARAIRNIGAGGYGYPAILSAKGYPTTTPAGAIGGALDIPPSYTGRWVVRWIGTGRLSLVTGGSAPRFTVHSGIGFVVGGSSTPDPLTIDGTNPRVEFSIASGQTTFDVQFPSNGTYSNMDNLIICRLSDEALIDAGEIFNPDFVAKWKELNPEAIRTLNWTNPNDNNNFAQFKYRLDANGGIGLAGWHPDIWVGTISGTDTYTCGAYTDMPATWTHGETWQGQFTNANTSTTPTINVGGRGAKALIRIDATNLGAGNITANQLATFIYDADLDKVVWTAGGMLRRHPIEIHVALANKIGCNLWYNFANHMTDASIVATTVYVRDNLRSDLTFLPEFSNEVWNFGPGFAQTPYCGAKGRALGLSSLNLADVYGFYGKKVREMMEMIAGAWAPRSLNTLKRVFAFQAFAALSTVNIRRAKGSDLGAWGYDIAPNRPIDHCDVMSYATYSSGAQSKGFDSSYNASSFADLRAQADAYATGDPASMEAALDWLDADLRANSGQGLGLLSSTIYPTWETMAAEHNKPVYCYEGGLEINAPSASRLTALGFDTLYSAKISALFTAYKNDYRAYKLVRDQFSHFKSQLHSVAPAFFLLGGPGQWSMLSGDLYSAPFKTYDAVRHFNNGQRRLRLT